MDDGDDQLDKQRRTRKKGLAEILANAARTTGQVGSTAPEQTLVELRCKACGGPRQGETTFVCVYCGASLV